MILIRITENRGCPMAKCSNLLFAGIVRCGEPTRLASASVS